MGAGQRGQAAAPADAPVDHSQHGGGMRMGAGQGGGMAMNMERRAEMQRQAEALLTPVLTAVQMAKYREAEEARMTQMRERMMQRGQ